MENTPNFKEPEMNILNNMINEFINFQIKIRDNVPLETNQKLFSASEDEINRITDEENTLGNILKKDEKELFNYYKNKSMEYFKGDEISEKELNEWFNEFIDKLETQKKAYPMMIKYLKECLNEEESEPEMENNPPFNKVNINIIEEETLSPICIPKNQNTEGKETSRISTKNLDLLPEIETIKKTCKSIGMLEAILFYDFRYYTYNSKWEDPRWKSSDSMLFMNDGQGNDFRIFFNETGAIICGFSKESPMSPWFYERYYDAIDIRIEQSHGVPPKPKPTMYADEFSGKQDFIKSVPEEFKDFMDFFFFEEGDKVYRMTYCIWRKYSDNSWYTGNSENDPDYSEHFLKLLDCKPETFLEWANNYYETDEEGKENRELRKQLYPDDDFDSDLYLNIDLVKYFYDMKPINNKIIQEINPSITIEDLKEDIEYIGYPIE